MKKHFKEKKSIATKHSKSYLVGAGIFLLASTLIGGTIYATISSTWTSPSTLEATAEAELTSSSWNKLLGNIQYLYDNKANLSVVNTKANLASPALTGTPTSTTAEKGTNSKQIATTEFVQNALGDKANLASPTFTGTPRITANPASTSNDNQIATTSFVQAAVTTAVNTAVNNVLSSISTGGGGSGGSPASLKAPFICNARSWISLGVETFQWSISTSSPYSGVTQTFTNGKYISTTYPSGRTINDYPAFKACADLGTGRYLPTRDILISLAGATCINDLVVVKSGFFWSSTEYTSGYAYYVKLSDGTNDYYSRTNTRYVLCAHD